MAVFAAHFVKIFIFLIVLIYLLRVIKDYFLMTKILNPKADVRHTHDLRVQSALQENKGIIIVTFEFKGPAYK